MSRPRSAGSRWPDGRPFAFTVFDDTDHASIENVGPVYDLLADLGFRTTKSVWPIQGPGTPLVGGLTADDRAYRDWTLALQRRGFEIGYHGASNVTSPRAQVARALDRFRAIYGHDPGSMANHTGCGEAIYWGADRLTGPNRLVYDVLTGFRRRGFEGHRPDSPLFWGDLCRDRVRYVRNFTFPDVDTLAACPPMPYHDPTRPYVNAWFASSEGQNVASYTERISEANQERLEASGGACIMYTHFASGFVQDGRLDRTFVRLMERLARAGGWYVPVTPLLDYLQAEAGSIAISPRERSALERRWLLGKLRTGSS